MQFKYFISFLCCLIVLCCTSRPSTGEDYSVGAGDVLTITVFGYDELKTTARVSANGNITFPLIGEVHIGGLRIPDAAAKIAAMLADGYIIRPQISIFIEAFKSKKTIILGQVEKPGVIELRGPTTLLTLISRAGGLKEDAGETATIKRTIDGKRQTLTIDLKALLEEGDMTKNIPILGGDTVSISRNGTCYITGQVNQPNAYPYDRDITVLKLISLAGGFNGKAAKSSVKIVRVIDAEKHVFENVELNAPLQIDDVVIVPESFF